MGCCAMSCRRACSTASGNVTNTRMDSRWIGLHGPHIRILWMNKELTATVSINRTHDQPIRRWDGALWRGELNDANCEGSDGRQGVHLDDAGSVKKRREGHRDE